MLMMRNILFYLMLALVISCDGTNYTSVKFDSTIRFECAGLEVRTELWNKNHNMQYVRSELWTEYDPNTVDMAVQIPDSLSIHTFLTDFTRLYTGEKHTEEYFLKITLQFEIGESADCMNVVNPRLLDETIVLGSSRVTSDVLDDHIRKTDRPYKMVTNIALRRMLFDSNISLPLSARDVPKRILNKIHVRTYLGKRKENLDCIYEFVHPICASVPNVHVGH